jgi:hypothetical protein
MFLSGSDSNDFFIVVFSSFMSIYCLGKGIAISRTRKIDLLVFILISESFLFLYILFLRKIFEYSKILYINIINEGRKSFSGK